MARKALDAAASDTQARRFLRRAEEELHRAIEGAEERSFGDTRDMYDRSYYQSRGSRNGVSSGYEVYDRTSSNADKAAYLLWKHFPEGSSLELGCAMGYLVEALRERSFDAWGVDVSQYAIENAAPGVRPFLRRTDASGGLPFADESFDMVIACEMLEHVDPSAIPTVLKEMRRVCRSYVFATIPSFGQNPHGMDGWLDGKVVPERLDYYRELGDSFTGPVPFADLLRDGEGRPIEGHLTIASFSWWYDQFAAAGFVPRGKVTQRVYDDLHEMELAGSWNTYVFATPGAKKLRPGLRSADEVAAVREVWKI